MHVAPAEVMLLHLGSLAPMPKAMPVVGHALGTQHSVLRLSLTPGAMPVVARQHSAERPVLLAGSVAPASGFAPVLIQLSAAWTTQLSATLAVAVVSWPVCQPPLAERARKDSSSAHQASID
jgi:hypothetical protein